MGPACSFCTTLLQQLLGALTPMIIFYHSIRWSLQLSNKAFGFITTSNTTVLYSFYFMQINFQLPLNFTWTVTSNLKKRSAVPASQGASQQQKQLLCFSTSDQRLPQVLTLHFPFSLTKLSALIDEITLTLCQFLKATLPLELLKTSCLPSSVAQLLSMSPLSLWLRGNIFLCVTSVFPLNLVGGDASPSLPLISSLISVEGDISLSLHALLCALSSDWVGCLFVHLTFLRQYRCMHRQHWVTTDGNPGDERVQRTLLSSGHSKSQRKSF